VALPAEDDDLAIELGEAQPPEPLRQPRPDDASGVVVQAGDGPPQEPEVFLHLDAVAVVLEHATDNPRVEAGGLLVGEACMDEAGAYVLVEAAIAAATTDATSTSLTFTQEAWSGMLAERDRLYPERQVVGWYHTHPGLRVFLSAPDQFIHRGFFSGKHDVAVVVDPRRREWGVFRRHGDCLESALRFFIYSDHAGDGARLADAIGRLGPAGDVSSP